MIVVGIDGSNNAWRALEWAAGEAERRHDTVVVAHAGDLDPDGSAYGDFAHELLSDAIARLAEDHPKLPRRAEYGILDAGSMLVELSLGADLVVIGRSGAGRIARIFVGSTAQQVLAHAHSPLVVIGDHITAADAHVVVGVSMTDGGLAAMRFACAEARRRDVTLLAVRAWAEESWTRIGAGDALSTFDDWQQGERAVMDKWITAARSEFPDVRVEGELTTSPVYRELEKYAASAALLVLGCRRSDEAPIARVGPIASWAVRVAKCPVAIVGHRRADVLAMRTASPVSGAAN